MPRYFSLHENVHKSKCENVRGQFVFNLPNKTHNVLKTTNKLMKLVTTESVNRVNKLMSSLIPMGIYIGGT